MKVAIIGSRTFINYEVLCKTINKINKEKEITHIISGGAKGTDSLAEIYAKNKQLPITIYYAKWDYGGKIAGFNRNTTVVLECDLLIAFWDQESRGTKDSIDKIKKIGKPFRIYNFKGELLESNH